MACGKLKQVLAKVRDDTRRRLMDTLSMKHDGITDPLSDEDFALVFFLCLKQVDAGVSQIELGMSVKMAWMEQLPWQLCGMAHPDLEEARKKASHYIKLFESVPASKNHRQRKKFLDAGCELRTCIDEFVETGNMEPVLQFNLLPFYVLPFDDTLIERELIPLSRVARVQGKSSRGSTYSTRRADPV